METAISGTEERLNISNVLEGPGLAGMRLDEPSRPDPELRTSKPRRRFTAGYKVRVLAQLDACTEFGGIARLLRREGLYSTQVAQWRKARNTGILNGLSAQKRGVKPQSKDSLANRVAELEKEKAELVRRLETANTIIDVQKKVAEIFGRLSEQKSSEMGS